MTEPSPAVAVAVRFVGHINRRDLDGVRRLLTADHRLEVFDEEPLVGRDANSEAWRGYFEAFPHYVIYPDRLAERDGTVAILGHTTGSHLGLPDDEERQLRLIWLVDIDDGAVARWKLIEDNETNRRRQGLAHD
jgi:ketosteroid isomerase-like protein